MFPLNVAGFKSGVAAVDWTAGRILDLSPDALALANNDPVASWAAAVGGITFAQSTGSLKPIYKASAKNGRPGVLFDATDDGFPNGFATGSPAALTVAIVATTTSNLSPGFINAEIPWFVVVGRAGLSFYNGAYVSAAGSTPAGSTHIVVAQTSAAGSACFLDGVDVTADADPTSIPATLYLGQAGAAGFVQPADGTLLRWVVWSEFINTAKRQAFENAMAALFAL